MIKGILKMASGVVQQSQGDEATQCTHKTDSIVKVRLRARIVLSWLGDVIHLIDSVVQAALGVAERWCDVTHLIDSVVQAALGVAERWRDVTHLIDSVV